MADEKFFEEMMKKAISLARKAEGQTAPNPLVGAVLFNNRGIISTGYHRRAGLAHAETIAIDKAGQRAVGATLVVNLEPCCHHGRTGPCTEAIIRAGIKRVVYAISDPNITVCGRGCNKLKDAGVELIVGVGSHQAERLNEVYLKHITTGRPFVALKTAQSLDGRLATSTGDSQWISGPEALKLAHKLRAKYDAVAVGSGTVRFDNPSLTVRHVRGDNPIRIILTASGDLPEKINLFENNRDNNTIVATTASGRDRLSGRQVMTWTIRKAGTGLDLNQFLKKCGEVGITSLLVEGGGQLATSFLKQGLIDKIYQVVAPMIIGSGLDAVRDLKIRRLKRAIRISDVVYKRLGQDNLLIGYPEYN